MKLFRWLLEVRPDRRCKDAKRGFVQGRLLICSVTTSRRWHLKYNFSFAALYITIPVSSPCFLVNTFPVAFPVAFSFLLPPLFLHRLLGLASVLVQLNQQPALHLLVLPVLLAPSH